MTLDQDKLDGSISLSNILSSILGSPESPETTSVRNEISTGINNSIADSKENSLGEFNCDNQLNFASDWDIGIDKLLDDFPSNSAVTKSTDPVNSNCSESERGTNNFDLNLNQLLTSSDQFDPISQNVCPTQFVENINDSTANCDRLNASFQYSTDNNWQSACGDTNNVSFNHCFLPETKFRPSYPTNFHSKTLEHVLSIKIENFHEATYEKAFPFPLDHTTPPSGPVRPQAIGFPQTGSRFGSPDWGAFTGLTYEQKQMQQATLRYYHSSQPQHCWNWDSAMSSDGHPLGDVSGDNESLESHEGDVKDSLRGMNKRLEGKNCGVCGDRALGYNFNAVTCESCKAFFRRNALKNKEYRCPFNDECEVTAITRRFCQRCRLRKCFEIGMRKDWIMTDEEKKKKRKKIEENRAKKYPPGSSEFDTDEGTCVSRRRGSEEECLFGVFSEEKVSLTGCSGEEDRAMPLLGVGSTSGVSKPKAVVVGRVRVEENEPKVLKTTRTSDIGSARVVIPYNHSEDGIKREDIPHSETHDFPISLLHERPSTSGLDDGAFSSLIDDSCKENRVEAFRTSPNFGSVHTVHPPGPLHPSPPPGPSSSHKDNKEEFFNSGFFEPSQSNSFCHSTPGLDMDHGDCSLVAGLLRSQSQESAECLLVGDIKGSEPRTCLNLETKRPEIVSCSSFKNEREDLGPSSSDSSQNPFDSQSNAPSSSLSSHSVFVDHRTNADCSNPMPSSQFDFNFGEALNIIQPEPKPKNQKCPTSDSTNSVMDSIVCMAVKAEYLASEDLLPHSHSLDLNEAEAKKIAELIEASKGLNSPLCEDPNFKDLPNPSLINVINLTEIAIRRLIKMSKKIAAFKKLCQEDQIALLKGGCTEMMILRSVSAYDPDKDVWKIQQDHQRFKDIKLNVLEAAPGNVYEAHKKFILSFEADWRHDNNIIALLAAIALFTPERPNVVHPEAVRHEQGSYLYLLKRYLECRYGGCEGKTNYHKLLCAIAHLHVLNEDHVRVFLEVNPKEVEPLLIEIFDLKQS